MSWSNDGPRPLRSTLWFPADTAADESPWLIGPRLLPLFKAGWSVPNAAPADGRYPLVVMSHGTGGATAQLSWLAEALAAAGYVVAAVNHHGNTAIEPGTPHGFFLWWERAQDLRILIDRVLGDEVFAPRVDPGRIGAAGFSLGGYTVLEIAGARTDLDQLETYCVEHEADPNCTLPPEAPFSEEDLVRNIETDPDFRSSIDRHRLSYRDPRVRSAVALAPAAGMALTAESLQRVSIEILILVGDRDAMAPADTNARRIADFTSRSSIEVLPGVGHYTFLAECGILGRVVASPLCAEGPGVSRDVIHAQVAQRVRNFFDDTLSTARWVR